MSENIRVVVTGVSGRMGQMIVSGVLSSKKTRLVGALEREGHEWIGKDLGLVSGLKSLGVEVSDDPASVFKNADAIIDFSAPKASVEFSKLAAECGIVHVIGTTGFNDQDLALIENSGKKAKIIRAGNMSLGVNLLVQLTKKVAANLDNDFDIEIIETHHNKKVDAPSGTALMLGNAAADGRQISLSNVRDSGRDGITGARNKGDIGFVSIRGGDVVGEHDVLFAAAGERITLRHVATDRAIFVRGALKAVEWGIRQEPGEYSMKDVLDL
ncbi:MAG: 4-hydroxy-tetrahydrodipicolinate reductase [Paracoccaceae bacterium]|uniref:4-hydroxy-tetrahydrodipicolinate reductase n=1 Tax=Candidatus Salinivivens marinus TaxID=3381703 RepID=UPI000BE097B6|nr:MAG: 4-hydroxy-tetrahydrodipicolinate reductase [Rhodobacteraceae bacterium MED-G08]|tara:strand:+ start:4608 stop:5417 length:810 start_codon:yes stop_codon:yes gene_type:complete